MSQPYGQQPDPAAQPGGYPQQGGYSQQGHYPQSGQFPQPVYPQAPPYAQGYSGLPQAPAGYERMSQKPGTVTGAAVLGFIQAGITLLTTGFLFIVLAAGSGAASDLGIDVGGQFTEGWVVAFVQLAGLIMLIFGSVQLMSGTSRNLYLAAAGLEIAICLYWLIRSVSASGSSATGVGVGIVIPLLFAIMPVIGLILALGSATTQYMQSRRA